MPNLTAAMLSQRLPMRIIQSPLMPMTLSHYTPAPLAPFGSGIKVAATQNSADGQFVNVISQVCQRALDATVTPGRIRFGHLADMQAIKAEARRRLEQTDASE